MSDQTEKKRGSLAGGVAGLAVGVCILSVLLVLTSRSIVLMLLIAPLVTTGAGLTLGEKVSFFGRRHVAVIAVSLILLVVGAVLPIQIQKYRFERLRSETVPVFPDSESLGVDMRVVGAGGQIPGFAMRYRVDASFEDVLAYMRVELESNGWKENYPVESGDDVLYRFERPGFVIHVTDDPAASEYFVMCSAFNFYYKRKYVPPPEEDTA